MAALTAGAVAHGAHRADPAALWVGSHTAWVLPLPAQEHPCWRHHLEGWVCWGLRPGQPLSNLGLHLCPGSRPPGGGAGRKAGGRSFRCVHCAFWGHWDVLASLTGGPACWAVQGVVSPAPWARPAPSRLLLPCRSGRGGCLHVPCGHHRSTGGPPSTGRPRCQLCLLLLPAHGRPRLPGTREGGHSRTLPCQPCAPHPASLRRTWRPRPPRACPSRSQPRSRAPWVTWGASPCPCTSPTACR